MKTKSFIDDLEYRVTGACIEVHRILGAGLLESIYHKCLERELHFRGITSVSNHIVSVNYKGETVNTELRADLVVEDCLVVELKAVESVLPIHEAQLLTYMKLLKAPKGLLINFNCTNIIQSGKNHLLTATTVTCSDNYAEGYLKVLRSLRCFKYYFFLFCESKS